MKKTRANMINPESDVSWLIVRLAEVKATIAEMAVGHCQLDINLLLSRMTIIQICSRPRDNWHPNHANGKQSDDNLFCKS